MQKIRYAMAAGAALFIASATAGAQLRAAPRLPRTHVQLRRAGRHVPDLDRWRAGESPAGPDLVRGRASRVPTTGASSTATGRSAPRYVYGQQNPVYGATSYDPRRDPRNSQYDPRLDRTNSRYDRRYEDDYNRKQAKIRAQYLKKQQKEREKYERKMEKAREQDARNDQRGTGIRQRQRQWQGSWPRPWKRERW